MEKMERPVYGKHYTVNIEGYNSDGDGVARIGGEVVFIPGTAKGDECEIKIVNTRSKYAWGELEKVNKTSSDRIDCGCEAYPLCGGCALRHINYDAELLLKAQRVTDAFERIGGICIELEGITGAPKIERYRNKALYPVRRMRGENVAGFYRRASHDIVSSDDCILESKISVDVLNVVLEYMKKYNVRAYDEKSSSGIIRHVYVRTSRNDTAIVCIVSTKPVLPAQDKIIELLREKVPQVRGVLLNLNTRRDNVILSGRSKTLWGDGYIKETLLGKDFILSADSFFQINPDQTENLYKCAGEFLGTCRELLDLYCGVGSIGISLSDHADHVMGVEIVPQAVEDAQRNANINGLNNISFLCADAGEAAQKLCDEGKRPDAIIVDPPRKGLDSQCIEAIVKMSPEKLIYISCNPATQARDCAILAKHGYNIDRLRAFDMFPRTSHVETVVLMSRWKV